MRLEVDIASKTFKNAAGEQHDVIAGVTFALDAGEIGAFVGPSGCGKSTMIRILADLDHDFQGRVSRPVGARIGIVFQEPRLLPWRSVEENVRLVAPLADDARLSALFEILELKAHRNHFPGELSLGLARRGFSPTCLSAHRAASAETPKSPRSSWTSCGASMAIPPRRIPHRQCLRPVLTCGIDGIDDETLDRNRSARSCSCDHNRNGAGHDASC